MRPSKLIQFIAFGSLGLSPWFYVFGILSVERAGMVMLTFFAMGALAALWHRNTEEA